MTLLFAVGKLFPVVFASVPEYSKQQPKPKWPCACFGSTPFTQAHMPLEYRSMGAQTHRGKRFGPLADMNAVHPRAAAYAT